MICGFDYGTSNCAIGVMTKDRVNLLPVDGEKTFMPSALYALGRELICEQVGLGLPAGMLRDDFLLSTLFYRLHHGGDDIFKKMHKFRP